MKPRDTGMNPKAKMPCCRWCDLSPLWALPKAREGQLTSSKDRGNNKLSKFFREVRFSRVTRWHSCMSCGTCCPFVQVDA